MVLAPVVLSVAYVVVPYWLGTVVAGGGWRSRDLPIALGLVVLFTARIVLKDFRDRLGDERYGKPTLLYRLGKRTTCLGSLAGALIGSAIVIGAVAPSPVVAATLAVPVAGIAWMLHRLLRADDDRSEQVSIGVAARAGTGLLLSVLTILLLEAVGASDREIEAVVALVVAASTAGFLGPAVHPGTVRIGYKA
jgi:4-hydroxybenzoate polyprenyltransferase